MRKNLLKLAGTALLAATAAVVVTTSGGASAATRAVPAPVAGAVTAPAKLTGLVEARSPFEVSSVKSQDTMTATCPGQKVVVGTGFLITHPNVVATSLTLTEKTVTLRAVSDTTPGEKKWNATAMAYCADRPSGYSVVNPGLISPTVLAEKTAASFCPAGKQVLGTGFRTFGAAGRVVMDEILPIGTNKVAVKAFSRAPSASWGLNAQATCADPVLGRTVAVTEPHKVTRSVEGKSEESTCPLNTQVINTSFDLLDSLGQANPILSFRKTNIDPAFPRRSQTAAAVDITASTTPWGMVSYSICATK